MNFKQLNEKIIDQFFLMQEYKLFRVKMSGESVWETYINGFKEGQNPIFRDPNSSEHNCNNDKNFIRRYGNVVAIDDNNNIITMFDIDVKGTKYFDTIENLKNILKSKEIENVFFETFNELHNLPYEKTVKTQNNFQLGVKETFKKYSQEEVNKFGVVNTTDVHTFNHFHVFLDTKFVDKTGSSVESIMASYRDSKNVFKRGLDEITIDVLETVIDLIKQKSILDGEAHLSKVETFLNFKKKYNGNDNWCWVNSYQLPIAKFRNELIGVLCTELSQGEDLTKACQNWNKRVDPANYMKAVAPITSAQKEMARKFVEENGFVESFDRRFATLDDIKASEILHVGNKIKNVSIFDNVKTVSKSKPASNVEEVTIENFIENILPNSTSVEAYFENRMEGNLVSLTTANNKDSKPIFKWDNNYSWTFKGNLAGKSQIKDAVKSRGGNVEGVMRVSLAFPDTTDDYDLHLVEPNKNEIYYYNLRVTHKSSGRLDLDAQGKDGHQQSDKRVENIIYTDKSRMPIGSYVVYVNNYSGRGLHTKFTLEIEVEGEVTVLSLNGKTLNNKIKVATVHYDGNTFEIKPENYMNIDESKSISRELYGLRTNEFHKVNLVCLSPNHWDNNNQGNKHYLFMLDGCKADTSIRSFHNENLIGDLAQHRKVLEVLGASNMIESTDNQLSGLGFNATVKDELIVKTDKRVLKIKF